VGAVLANFEKTSRWAALRARLSRLLAVQVAA